MKRVIVAAAIITAYLFSGCSSSSEIVTKPGQHSAKFAKELTKKIGYKYLLYLPKDYFNQKKEFPLILFLHGSGERGDDLEAVKRNGPPKIVDSKDDFPFILVSPQCPQNENWSEGWAVTSLNALLDEVIADYNVDTSRIYLTGLSMGGFGTWTLAEEYPNRFAAIAPVCGGGDPDKACNIRRIPTWVFHGAKDNVAPISNAEEMVNVLKECGSDVQFTVYPEGGHDIWTETYNNPQLYEWFLSHSRSITKLLEVEKQNVKASSGNAYYAFDGNFGTRWESEWNDPQWLTINLGKIQKVNSLTIFWETAFGKEYEILSSADNKKWLSVYNEKNSNGGVDKIIFDNLETRYLKFNFLKRGTQWGYSIWEIEIE